jgi:ketosteroid isomerase-like protein
MRLDIKARPLRLTLESGRFDADALYRRAARRKITQLLAENHELRHGGQPRTPATWRTLERLVMHWIDRRYPTPKDTESSYGDVEVIEP